MPLKNNNPSHTLTREEQRRAGKKSGEVRAEKKKIREYLQMLLESEIGRDKNGNVISGAEAMAQKVFKEGLNGDWKAWELARDTAGQKPSEHIETDIKMTQKQSIAELEKIIKQSDV